MLCGHGTHTTLIHAAPGMGKRNQAHVNGRQRQQAGFGVRHENVSYLKSDMRKLRQLIKIQDRLPAIITRRGSGQRWS
jgi:hypothetical protein